MHNKIQEDKAYALKKKQLLKFNFWIIFGTWLPFVFIAVISNSLTLIAQMIMGAAQSLSVFLSWMTARHSFRKQTRLYRSEKMNALFMAFVFLASFFVVIGMATERIFNPREIKHDIALIGLLVNSFSIPVNFIQWRRNYNLSKQKLSLIMEGQWALFQIKFFTVLMVEISLLLFFLLEGKGIHAYIDSLFSYALAFLTLFSSVRLFAKSKNHRQ